MYEAVCLSYPTQIKRKEGSEHYKCFRTFFSYEGKDKDCLIDEIQKNHGRNVLFVLDGFDKFPKVLQREGFLLNLIKKTVLPQSTVVVTSRPSATAELLTSCRPQIQKSIEVLGFTQESVEAYVSSVLTDAEQLKDFLKYISSSENPAINSLMYVPLNAAIIVQIYLNCQSASSLPRTLTELYTQLCLTILNRYLKIEHPAIAVRMFSDLPEDLYKHFLELSEIAFRGMKKDEVIFHSNSLAHFGFLDSVAALYGGGEISYNFLHLTLQEFFAAIHISQLPDCGAEVFQEYGENKRWNVVWRFVAGLTKFQCFSKHRGPFCDVEGDNVDLSLLFVHCLFEA